MEGDVCGRLITACPPTKRASPTLQDILGSERKAANLIFALGFASPRVLAFNHTASHERFVGRRTQTPSHSQCRLSLA